jgi:hypothetical protein
MEKSFSLEKSQNALNIDSLFHIRYDVKSGQAGRKDIVLRVMSVKSHALRNVHFHY